MIHSYDYVYYVHAVFMYVLYICIYLKVYVCAYVHACVLNVVQYTCKGTHVYITYVRTYMCLWHICAYLHMYLRTYVPVDTDIYVHTYVHAYNTYPPLTTVYCLTVSPPYMCILFESFVCFNFCQFLAWPLVSMFHMCLVRNTPILKVRMGIIS